MLMLTRRVGEKVIIDADIEVVVYRIQGQQVRLGIQAPPDVPVYREEIYRKIQKKRKG